MMCGLHRNSQLIMTEIALTVLKNFKWLIQIGPNNCDTTPKFRLIFKTKSRDVLALVCLMKPTICPRKCPRTFKRHEIVLSALMICRQIKSNCLETIYQNLYVSIIETVYIHFFQINRFSSRHRLYHHRIWVTNSVQVLFYFAHRSTRRTTRRMTHLFTKWCRYWIIRHAE